MYFFKIIDETVSINCFILANVAPINPGSIPSVSSQLANNYANRTSVGGGISPVNFSTNSQVRSAMK